MWEKSHQKLAFLETQLRDAQSFPLPFSSHPHKQMVGTRMPTACLKKGKSGTSIEISDSNSLPEDPQSILMILAPLLPSRTPKHQVTKEPSAYMKLKWLWNKTKNLQQGLASFLPCCDICGFLCLTGQDPLGNCID